MTALVIILSIIAATVEILAIAACVFILNDMLKGRKSAKKGDDTHERQPGLQERTHEEAKQ